MNVRNPRYRTTRTLHFLRRQPQYPYLTQEVLSGRATRTTDKTGKKPDIQTQFTKTQTLMRKLSCVLLLVLLVGCSNSRPMIYNLKQDKSFVQPEILTGKMGIGGVVCSDPSLCAGERDRYADLLRSAIQEKRKGYAVFPATETEKNMGPDRYNEMLDSYRKLGFLCFDTLQEIKAVTREFRYFVMARIEANVTTEKTTRRPQTDDQGKEIEGERWVELATKRTVVVSLDVYDLFKSVSVMSGSLYERGTNEWAYGEVEGKDPATGFLQSFGSTCVQGFAEDTLQPRAPSFDKVLIKIFKGFALNMP